MYALCVRVSVGLRLCKLWCAYWQLLQPMYNVWRTPVPYPTVTTPIQCAPPTPNQTEPLPNSKLCVVLSCVTVDVPVTTHTHNTQHDLNIETTGRYNVRVRVMVVTSIHPVVMHINILVAYADVACKWCVVFTA